MEPPSDPPAYADDHDLRDVAHDEEFLLDDYDAVLVPSETRMDKLRRWKQKIVDPLVELYGYLNLKTELQLAKLGNPLIVKRVLYVLFISILFWVLSFTGVFPSDGSGYPGFSEHDPMIENMSVDFKLLEESLEYLMSVDHVSGTQGDLAVAEYVNAAFKQSRMQSVQIQEMRTLLNFPGKTTLEFEDVVLDVTEQFNPLSFNGEAEAGVVFLNRGFPSDYSLLEKDNSVEVKDKIGIVVIDETIPISQTALLAEAKGIKGLLFIDGEGPYESTFERISVAIPEYYTGDPLSPGWSSSIINARLQFNETTMLKIPSVSLSREQVKPILTKLADKGVKFANGKHSGDGTFKVKLSNEVTYEQDHTTWNVLGKFDGKEQPDKAVFIGSQRDSICPNGLNPNSGTSIMINLIKILSDFSELYDWRPLRSIYFISFDSSEYNFAGVTELLEAKSHEVKKEAIAYIDLSGELINGGDELKVFTSGLLSQLMDSYEKEFNLTLSENFQNYDNFIPFMNLGIPVLKPSYSKDSSVFKCQSNFKDLKKIDPNYEKHSKLIRLIARWILNISDDPLIPLNVSRYVDSLDKHLKSLQSWTAQKFSGSPIDFNGLMTPLLTLKQTGKDFDAWERAWRQMVTDDSGIEPSLLSVHRWNWNSRLNYIEKSMTELAIKSSDEHIRERKWYRNVISGPQLVKPESKDSDVDWFSFPTIRDVIDREGSTREDVENEINRVGDIIAKGNLYITD